MESLKLKSSLNSIRLIGVSTIFAVLLWGLVFLFCLSTLFCFSWLSLLCMYFLVFWYLSWYVSAYVLICAIILLSVLFKALASFNWCFNSVFSLNSVCVCEFNISSSFIELIICWYSVDLIYCISYSYYWIFSYI